MGLLIISTYCLFIEEELALDLDEDTNMVSLTIKALLQYNAVEQLDNDTLLLAAHVEMVGTETEDARRKRLSRAKEMGFKRKSENCGENIQPNDCKKHSLIFTVR